MGQSWMFTKGLDNINSGSIAIGVNSFKVALLASLPATTVQDTAGVYSEVSSLEVASGNGYTTGGQSITLTHQTYTTGGQHRGAVMGPASSIWAAANFSAAGAIVYRSDGANLYLAALVDFGGVKTASGGSFQINWDATNGIWYSSNTPA